VLGENGAAKQFFENLHTATIDATEGEALQLEISNGSGIVIPRKTRVVILDQSEGSKPPFDIGKKGTIMVPIGALFHEQIITIVAYPVEPSVKNGFKSNPVRYTGSLRYKRQGDAHAASATFIRAEHGQVEQFSFMLRIKEEKRS